MIGTQKTRKKSWSMAMNLLQNQKVSRDTRFKVAVHSSMTVCAPKGVFFLLVTCVAIATYSYSRLITHHYDSSLCVAIAAYSYSRLCRNRFRYIPSRAFPDVPLFCLFLFCFAFFCNNYSCLARTLNARPCTWIRTTGCTFSISLLKTTHYVAPRVLYLYCLYFVSCIGYLA